MNESPSFHALCRHDRAMRQAVGLKFARNDMELILRPFDDADLPLLRGWLHESHVARWYEQPEDWLREAENRKGEFSWIFHFIAERGGEPIGFCQLYEYCRGGETWHGDIDTAGAYSIDYLIGDTRFIGRGLGRALILSLLDRVRACEGARLVIVQPDERNAASRAALLSVGFEYDKKNRLFRLELQDGQEEHD